ncbi:MAG: DUF58 domain-containing protein [Phycisphaerales bacterium]|jgi:uncharacterized protein (DUF58 family)|nr:DUF58 domain-containing protein [Phycisphaerales bacterium]
MIPTELLKKIRRIEIATSRLASELLAGQYHSAFKGRGIEFEEVRPYQPGDDVRAIDWNVTARSGDPYIKQFREERELTVMLIVDMSGSQGFGTNEQTKRELITELCATLAFSAIRNNDKVGLLAFTDRIEKFVPPRKGTQHVLRVIRELLAHEPIGNGTDIAGALEYFRHVQRRRCTAFLVSDFQDDGWEQAIRVVRRKHDLVAIDVGDRRELELPEVGLLEMRDAESGELVLLDTSSKTVRNAWSAQAVKDADRRLGWMRRHRIDRLPIQTGESFVETLSAFFRQRGARMEH